jgi:hypothetical protein
MKSKFTITLILIIVVLGIIIFIITAPLQNAEVPIVKTTPTTEHSYTSIDHVFNKDDTETTTTSIHITKPVITGLSNEVVRKTINNQIDSAFSEIKKSFLSETSGVDTFSDETKHQLTVTGSAPYVSTDKIFYIDVEIYSYYSGAAHPLTQRIVLNFVKETGQLIRLEDILKKDSKGDSFTNALSLISSIAKPKIIEQLTIMIKDNKGEGSGADAFEESGTDPKMENYSVFYIHKDRVDWVFGQYQVAPYVFGEIKISVPLSEFEQYLAPRSYLK